MFEKIVRPCIHQCNKYVPGKPIEEVQRELGLDDIIKMASNENPFGCSPLAKKAMIDEINANINRYPESPCVDLVAKLAKKHNIDPSCIVTGNGLDNVITMIGMIMLEPKDEQIYSDLTFPAYCNIGSSLDATNVVVPMTEDERIDLSGFLKAITDRTKIIWVCNPNNPTGTAVSKKEVDDFIRQVPSNILVVFDEAYYDFADLKNFPDSRAYLDKYENVVMLRTFSKAYGLASQRIGYSVSSPEIAEYLLKVREPFPVNRLGSVGALYALDDDDFVKKTVKNNEEGLKAFYKVFEENHIKYYPSQTNFVYADLGQSCVDVFNKMLRDGVIIRPLAGQGRPNGARITVGTPEENERTIKSLLAALK